ncbi:hypothetical protein CAOG_001097 [Capsaspora owczarzaki ATCC 30864]|uniref:Tudor domain-containing protein n=1 Tax=Capsaspora owczarzaki (strain ATCC 30864) TaxID=595528 RepID=A0A0D2VI94_CAPO3|nr:hypothetical protein CAOG_001097 [Capsaspora owczarzaki ATCC 30864]
MADDYTPLAVGTDVSAKYRGAFCEAKVKSVDRVTQCKVRFNADKRVLMLDSTNIRGTIAEGATVDAMSQQDNKYRPATILRLFDGSTYTVEFDDGDIKTVKRNNLTLKGKPAFLHASTLDDMPLTDPETLVKVALGKKHRQGSKRSRKHANGEGGDDDNDDDDDGDDDDEDDNDDDDGSNSDEGESSASVASEHEEDSATIAVKSAGRAATATPPPTTASATSPVRGRGKAASNAPSTSSPLANGSSSRGTSSPQLGSSGTASRNNHAAAAPDNNPAPLKRELVLVNLSSMKPKGEEYWAPAFIVPTSELGGQKELRPDADECVVRVLEDARFLVVDKTGVKPFILTQDPYLRLARFSAFRENDGVLSALAYLKDGSLPDGFQWEAWEREDVRLHVTRLKSSSQFQNRGDGSDSMLGASDLDDAEEKYIPADLDIDAESVYPIGGRVEAKHNSSVYPAKVVAIRAIKRKPQYLIHYDGWNKRYDEWVQQSAIVRGTLMKRKPRSENDTPGASPPRSSTLASTSPPPPAPATRASTASPTLSQAPPPLPPSSASSTSSSGKSPVIGKPESRRGSGKTAARPATPTIATTPSAAASTVASTQASGSATPVPMEGIVSRTDSPAPGELEETAPESGGGDDSQPASGAGNKKRGGKAAKGARKPTAPASVSDASAGGADGALPESDAKQQPQPAPVDEPVSSFVPVPSTAPVAASRKRTAAAAGLDSSESNGAKATNGHASSADEGAGTDAPVASETGRRKRPPPAVTQPKKSTRLRGQEPEVTTVSDTEDAEADTNSAAANNIVLPTNAEAQTGFLPPTSAIIDPNTLLAANAAALGIPVAHLDPSTGLTGVPQLMPGLVPAPLAMMMQPPGVPSLYATEEDEEEEEEEEEEADEDEEDGKESAESSEGEQQSAMDETSQDQQLLFQQQQQQQHQLQLQMQMQPMHLGYPSMGQQQPSQFLVPLSNSVGTSGFTPSNTLPFSSLPSAFSQGGMLPANGSSLGASSFGVPVHQQQQQQPPQQQPPQQQQPQLPPPQQQQQQQQPEMGNMLPPGHLSQMDAQQHGVAPYAEAHDPAQLAHYQNQSQLPHLPHFMPQQQQLQQQQQQGYQHNGFVPYDQSQQQQQQQQQQQYMMQTGGQVPIAPGMSLLPPQPQGLFINDELIGEYGSAGILQAALLSPAASTSPVLLFGPPSPPAHYGYGYYEPEVPITEHEHATQQAEFAARTHQLAATVQQACMRTPEQDAANTRPQAKVLLYGKQWLSRLNDQNRERMARNGEADSQTIVTRMKMLQRDYNKHRLHLRALGRKSGRDSSTTAAVAAADLATTTTTTTTTRAESFAEAAPLPIAAPVEAVTVNAAPAAMVV